MFNDNNIESKIQLNKYLLVKYEDHIRIGILMPDDTNHEFAINYILKIAEEDFAKTLYGFDKFKTERQLKFLFEEIKSQMDEEKQEKFSDKRKNQKKIFIDDADPSYIAEKMFEELNKNKSTPKQEKIVKDNSLNILTIAAVVGLTLAGGIFLYQKLK